MNTGLMCRVCSKEIGCGVRFLSCAGHNYHFGCGEFDDDDPVIARIITVMGTYHYDRIKSVEADSSTWWSTFKTAFQSVCDSIYHNAVSKGFWEEDYGSQTDATKLNLVNTELAEVSEVVRRESPIKGAEMSKKLPGFTAKEEETADAVIRLMDYATGRKMRLAEAIVAKIEFNKTRAFKHGKSI